MPYLIVPADGYSGNVTRVISSHKTLEAARRKKGNYAKWQIVEGYGHKGQTFYMDTVGSVYKRVNPGRKKSASKRVSAALKKYMASLKKNPGRKVKGGRAVSLKNFTGSVIRKSNGQVVIKGKGKRTA